MDDGGSRTCSLREAVAAVEAGEVRLLTCDVFDTLVWRPVARPHHLFGELARRLRAGGWLRDWLDDRTFAMGRQGLEQRARRRALAHWGEPECTLEEIWELAPDSWWARPPEPGTGPAAEIEVERAALRLHRGTAELLEAARRHGVPAVLVSDTYLSPEQLHGLLTGAGLRLDGVDVVTSSARRRNKWGGLLDEVVAEHGGPAGALHVGDNPDSDVAVARRLGIAVCHVDVAAADDAVAAAHAPWQRASDAAGTDGGRAAVVRETLVDAGPAGRDPSYQFGVAVAGPVMAGFAGWASATAERLGATTLHCLLREGARIAELIDVVRPEGPKRVLVHASRWAVLRAAVIDGTPEQLERALARRTDLRADHVAEAFGCDAGEVAAVIGGRSIPRDRRLGAYEALSRHGALREQIVAASARQRANAFAYLARTLHLDDDPVVLCDIGWGGTIQEGIADILRAEGFDREIVGLYALLSPPGELRAANGVRMLGYLPTVGPAGVSVPHAEVAIRHPEILERVNTPALGTLLDYGEGGTPVTRPDDHDEIGDSLRMAQRGVVDFAARLAAVALDDQRQRDAWFHDPLLAGAALEALATVIRSPDPRLATALGTWRHDDVAGTGHEALSDVGFRRWLPYANAVDASAIPMHEVFWVPGVASAAGSDLARQLDALAGGANPDVLCPPSPTGTARIAVFPPGSALATAQTELTPRLGAHGWMLLQLATPIDGLRSVRIDLGAVDLLADVGDVEVVVRTRDGAEQVLCDGPAGLSARARPHGGRWLGAARAAVAAGGHLLLDLDPATAADVEWVSVVVAYRTWALDDPARRALLPRWRTELTHASRRVRSRLGR